MRWPVVSEPVKAERLARLQTLLEEQKQSFNRAQMGSRLPVLFEKTGRNPGQLVGHSPYLQAVHANVPASELGQIVDLEITEVLSNSLTGQLPNATARCA